MKLLRLPRFAIFAAIRRASITHPHRHFAIVNAARNACALFA
jgi:hypothetical protein